MAFYFEKTFAERLVSYLKIALLIAILAAVFRRTN